MKTGVLDFVRQHWILTGVVVLAAVLTVWWRYEFPSATWRYKITVEVETPEGLKTGSAVREVTNRDNTLFGVQIPEAGSRISQVKGEAVVIDLGERGVVFALIENGSYGELYSAFSVRNPSNSTEDFKKLKVGMISPLPEKNWPMFVTFKDISDPKSVFMVRGWDFDAKVQKQFLVDGFEKVLGEGVRLKSIAIEITDEPVTWGVMNEYLSEEFWNKYHKWVNSTKITEREFTRLFRFREGNKK